METVDNYLAGLAVELKTLLDIFRFSSYVLLFQRKQLMY